MQSTTLISEKGFHLYLNIQTASDLLSLGKESKLHLGLLLTLTHYFDVRDDLCYKFDPYGSSGSFILAESHANYHTFPEMDKIVIDIYSCVLKVDTDKLKQDLIRLFGDNTSVLDFDLSYR